MSKMRVQFTILVELGDPLPETMKMYECESVDGKYKYNVKIRKISKLEWIDGKLAIDIRGEVDELVEVLE